MKYVLTLIFSLILAHSQALLPHPTSVLTTDSATVRQNKQSAESYQNTKLDASYQEQAQIAISHYPELKGVSIEFVRKNIKTTMASRPTFDFIFRKKKNRRYRIYIDTQVKNGQGLLLSDVPHDAQVGVIGHELAHIVDYENKTTMGVVLTGIGYLFHPLRRKLEHKVDEITIAHGLGHQVKEFSEYVLQDDRVSEKYKKYKRKIYYKPKQLSTLMSGYSIYQDSKL
ncbi:hypothetical protein [uncultured Sunxiuqinia sp.]|uniref:hypothetical protein n=1 Tax=Sunxiuqinia rutila TaxID=1397841 RepID=UPI0026290CD4|nr:hypothetical protein [uncultured Sunxiuqinia sp.]